ncbi:PTS fructose transporter subunit IIC [uncultured Anaerococcus sp.]|uniref:PTS fructose transporter subunit IIC n=1 Tax=uncultured Anaerococcus sp. TaxID=293428 RepID=UPI002606A9C6|nr:PTS fructose transporter subunit IIC [uncultured Anaerococcus sp.]
MANKNKNVWEEIKKAFSTGISYMLPVVVVGGLFLAIALSTGTPSSTGVKVTNPFMKNLELIGGSAFSLMVPLLAGYISYSIAGKPGLVPGMVSGVIAANPVGEAGVSTGFLGGMIVGIIAGYSSKWVKSWKVPQSIKPIMPILVIPLLVTFITSLAYIYLLAGPLSGFVSGLTNFLSGLRGSSAILVGVIIGAFTSVDMGGPINKTVSAFTLALMAEGVYTLNGAHRIAVAIPPIGVALSALLFRKKYTEDDRAMAISSLLMGCFGITEGAIPYAVKDLKAVIPSIVVGSAVGGAIGMMNDVECLVPHGGFIVLGAVNGKLWFALAIIIGSLVTALMLYLLKPDLTDDNLD